MTTENPPVQFAVLSSAAYSQLVKAVGVPVAVDSETTVLRAGFQLGVQHVLTKLREGFTFTQ